MTGGAKFRGRGAAENPSGRFERFQFEPDPEELAHDPDAQVVLETQYFRDAARSIIARNDSPDIGYDASVNPYRGCSVGCAYCYARPYHEFLGLSPGLDFETKIFVKENAPALLRKELASRRWKPQVIAMCGVTDPYQPVERHLQFTRRCLEVLAAFRNPVSVVTKNRLITRDCGLLASLASRGAASVCLSITTLDADLARIMEPRASAPSARLEAMSSLAAAGVPVGVMVAPVIPGLTDHEIPAILKAAAGAGAGFAMYSVVRLPHGVAELFSDWLERHMPDRKRKVWNRVLSLHDGNADCTGFGARFHGTGAWAEQIAMLFDRACARCRLPRKSPMLSTAGFRVPGPRQLNLFD
jgi:DNA repair photolyase